MFGSLTGGGFKPANPSPLGAVSPFGGSLASTTSSGPSTTGFSFGAPSQTSQPASTGGLFGTPAPAAAPQGGGLFGSTSAPASQPTTGLSLFGSQPAQQPQQQQTGGLGGFSFGAPQQQQQQPQQQQQQQQPLAQQQQQQQVQLTKTTKFNDLPDAYRAVIEGLETKIRQQTQIADEIRASSSAASPMGREILAVQAAHQAAAADFRSLAGTLDADDKTARAVRAEMDVTLGDIMRLSRLLEALKTPSSATAGVMSFPLEFFTRKMGEMKARIKRHKEVLDLIEHQVGSLGASNSLNPSSILPALRAQHQTFMLLLSRVAELDSALTKLKEDYTAIWRKETGSLRDPFFRSTPGAKEDNGMEGLKIGA